MKTGQIFETKRDLTFKLTMLVPLYVFLTLPVLISILHLLDVLNFPDILILLFVFLLGLIGLLAWKGLRYKIEHKSLIISIYNFEIYSLFLSRVISVDKYRKSSYVYGFSYDCISLKLSEGEVNISPQNLAEFIQKLKEANERIVISDKLNQLLNS